MAGVRAMQPPKHYFTIETLLTCGHKQMWKVGIGDMSQQLKTMYNIGINLGLRYVHTSLRPEGQLPVAHRGSRRLLDVDVEEFLGLGDGEPRVGTLPQDIQRERIIFERSNLEEVVAQVLDADAGAPRLFVLRYSYNLQFEDELDRLAYCLGVELDALRSPVGFRFAEKYARARARDGYKCGWREGAVRVAVHVRRGDRAWVEDESTLYCMHRGLWTTRNLAVRPSNLRTRARTSRRACLEHR